MTRPQTIPAWAGYGLTAACFLGACSAEGYRLAADTEVYGILGDKRSSALGPESAPVDFRVEAPESSLRSRLLEQIEAGQRPKVKLTLAEALDVAAENSRAFQDQKERLYLAALTLTGQRNRYSTIFSAGNDSEVSGVGDDEVSGSTTSSVSASRLLASGASILTSFVNSFFRVFTSGGGWDATSILSMSITQPLLRGFGSEVTLEPLTQAERNTVYAIRTYERFRRTFSVDVIAEYLAVLEQQNNLSNQSANYQSLQENTKRSVKLAEAGRVPKFQVDQARQQELSAQDGEIAARARLQSSIDRFKVTLGLPMQIDLDVDPTVLETIRGIGVGAAALTEEEASTIAFERRLDWKNSNEQVVDAERQVRVAADALRMGLDLSAAVDVPNERDEKAGKLNWHRVEWQVGLSLDLPLNKVPERNVYRSSMLALDAERRAHTLLEDNVRLSVRNALRDLQAAHRSYEIQKNALALAQDRVKSTTMLIDAGRAVQRDYLEAERDLLQSQNSLTSALVDYVIARLRLLRDLEALDVGAEGLAVDLESLRRWLEEGSDKAPGKETRRTP